jgi:signal transduction histidine kinase
MMPVLRGPRPRALSLEQKLPLLISGLLLLTLLGASWAAYAEVKHSALLASTEHLRRVTRQLADLSQASSAQRATLMRSVAADTAIRSLLRSRATTLTPAAAAAVARVATPTDSTPVIELRDATGQLQIAAHPLLPAVHAEHALALIRGPDPADSAGVGPFYAVGDSVFFWTAARVVDHGAPLGYLLQRRYLTNSPRTEQQIRGLIGQDISVYVTNTTGTLWTTLAGVSSTRPASLHETSPGLFEYGRPDGSRVIASEARITGTPWIFVVATPRATVLQRARAFLQRLALILAVIVLLGTAAAWALSRHVTRPLAALTTAAEAIAAGDYGRRVDLARGDELGRLGDTFNTMAARVAQSRASLERQAAELRHSNEALARQTAAAEEARTEAEAASRAKSDFLAVMSHEIRTPINAMIGYTQLLEMGLSGPVTDEQCAQLERVRASGRHLLALVNEVLDLAKVEAGELRVRHERAVVADAADAALALTRPDAVAKGIVIPERSGGARNAMYIGDDQRVRQILVNLISNAIKFTNPGGRVSVSSSVSGRLPAGIALPGEGPWTCVRVDDTGIGIAPDKLAAVFEPFVQAERGLTRTKGGAGLGLSISQRLARLMDGDLTVSSRPGAGSSFFLWLPAAPEPADLQPDRPVTA